jgi:hypothetical protein
MHGRILASFREAISLIVSELESIQFSLAIFE